MLPRNERPDFLIIGAPRAGTTALYRFLMQHPDVFLPEQKEPHFLCVAHRNLGFQGPGDELVNRRWVTSPEDYRALFRPADEAQVRGEASTNYLWCPRAPGIIERHLGRDVQMVAILRDPVDRAWSMFHYLRREGYEPCARFEDALAREDERAAAGWAPTWRYVSVGRYAEQLERYRQRFDPMRLLIQRYEDLERDPTAMLSHVRRFIGVGDDHDPDVTVRHNVSGQLRSRWLHNLLTESWPGRELVRRHAPAGLRDLAARIVARNVRPPETLQPDTRRRVLPRFVDDIEALEDLLGWDLTDWKTV